MQGASGSALVTHTKMPAGSLGDDLALDFLLAGLHLIEEGWFFIHTATESKG